MKKIVLILLSSAVILCSGCGNKAYVDTVRTFDYAYISLPNGEVVEGEVQSWRDFEDGDQLQIKIDGVTYLTDSTRAVLIHR